MPATRSRSKSPARRQVAPEAKLEPVYTTVPEVRIRFNVLNLIAVDVPSHMFKIHFFLEASWEDRTETLSESDSCEADGIKNLIAEQFPYRHGDANLHWTPRLGFGNAIELEDREDWVRIYTKTKAGRKMPRPVVCYRLRAAGSFAEHYELHNFPFDAQDLSVQVVSWYEKREEGAETLILKTNESKEYQSVVPYNHHRLMEEYHMSPQLVSLPGHTDVGLSSSGFAYPQLSIALKVSRNPNFFVANVVIPMFLFVLLCFPVFVLDTSALADRLGVIYTLLLTCVAYKLWINEHLPRCSYQMRLDKYILFCIGTFLFFSVESTLIYQLDKLGRCSDEGTWWSWLCKHEDTFGGLLLTGWIVLHLYIWKSTQHVPVTFYEQTRGAVYGPPWKHPWCPDVGEGRGT